MVRVEVTRAELVELESAIRDGRLIPSDERRSARGYFKRIDRCDKGRDLRQAYSNQTIRADSSRVLKDTVRGDTVNAVRDATKNASFYMPTRIEKYGPTRTD